VLDLGSIDTLKLLPFIDVLRVLMLNGAVAVLGFTEAQGVLSDWQSPQTDGSVQFIPPDFSLLARTLSRRG
jgi:hypothetical protein